MGNPYDTQLIMMVVQKPFENLQNQFCKLAPLVYIDGERPEMRDFLNDGEIWWMLTAKTVFLAEPGRLVVGMVENAIRYDQADPNSSCFQVKKDSVRELDAKEGMEIIDLPGDTIDNIQDIVSGGCRLDLPVRPTPVVMLRWRSQVFGPFLLSQDSYGTTNHTSGFLFSPANTTDLTVYRMDEGTYRIATKEYYSEFTENVSLTSHRRSDENELKEIKHDLVLGPGHERVLAENPEKLILEPIDRKLLRFAKQCLKRKQYRQLRALLEELEVKGRESDKAEDFLEAINHIKHITERQDTALDETANALLKSGLLGDGRIRKAEQEAGNQYVEERTAELQAKVEENLAIKHEELRQLEGKMKNVQMQLQNEERQGREKFEQELQAERKKARKAIATDQEVYSKQKAELKRQQDLLQDNLKKVTKELREEGDLVVNRFLTISPLLGSLWPANRQPIHNADVITRDKNNKNAPPKFDMPAFITNPVTPSENKLKEDAFFDRFCQLVEESGFTYRPLDLKRFHLSVKNGDITVLGGPSGTGKSSLPMLYSLALLGDEAKKDRPGCLMVNINPSWMEIRDLLGHMNTLEGRFFPAESGLFQHLVYAQTEYKNREEDTGLYLTCLDEMNMSQVEHYFSDFMMVLERSGPHRTIECFSPEVAGKDCPFQDYGHIELSPAVRFVGTVNFDETTRLLSDRFLDRVNLIRLTPGTLPGIAGTISGSFASASGPMVTLTDYNNWRADSALPAELGALLDQMRPLLKQIGCPVSPRVYRAACQFVASAHPILTAHKAFDVQIAQRIIPKIRSLMMKQQLDALDKLLKLLDNTSVCSFEETIPLLEEIRESAEARAWDLEE